MAKGVLSRMPGERGNNSERGKAAGVSAMSVSNVIDDLPDVRKETREKALDAMARLDYRVNVAARNLRPRTRVSQVTVTVVAVAWSTSEIRTVTAIFH
ncbi:LacI family DNA-binding transcriptional regulator [Streptomyces sp. NPDC088921]|uniref:LacI family DNA-binding transcriptional regulator n=1 Tax=unclassified Streptomyces TaxID=2593676 RepID=UPI00342A7BBA